MRDSKPFEKPPHSSNRTSASVSSVAGKDQSCDAGNACLEAPGKGSQPLRVDGHVVVGYGDERRLNQSNTGVTGSGRTLPAFDHEWHREAALGAVVSNDRLGSLLMVRCRRR